MQVCTRKVTFSLASVARARGRKRPNPEGEGPAEPGEASTAKGGDAMEVDGQGVALEPPQPQAPLLVPVLPSSAPLAQPPAVPSEPAPTEPPPSQHAAAQPMGIVQFCTLLQFCTGWWALLWTNHRAKGGHVDDVHLQARCI